MRLPARLLWCWQAVQVCGYLLPVRAAQYGKSGTAHILLQITAAVIRLDASAHHFAAMNLYIINSLLQPTAAVIRTMLHYMLCKTLWQFP